MKIDKTKFLQRIDESKDTLAESKQMIQDALNKAQTEAFNGVCQYVGNWEDNETFYKGLSITKTQVKKCEKLFIQKLNDTLGKKMDGKIDPFVAWAYYENGKTAKTNKLRYSVAVESEHDGIRMIVLFFTNKQGKDDISALITAGGKQIELSGDQLRGTLKILGYI